MLLVSVFVEKGKSGKRSLPKGNRQLSAVIGKKRKGEILQKDRWAQALSQFCYTRVNTWEQSKYSTIRLGLNWVHYSVKHDVAIKIVFSNNIK